MSDTLITTEHRNSVSSNNSSVGETVAPTVTTGLSSNKTADSAAKIRALGKEDASGYKTKMCRNQLQKGYCPYEVKCMFAHSEAELRTRFQNLNEGINNQNVVQEIVRDRVTEHRKLANHGVGNNLYLSEQLPTGLSKAKPLIGSPNVPVTVRVGGTPSQAVKTPSSTAAVDKQALVDPQQQQIAVPAQPATAPVAPVPVPTTTQGVAPIMMQPQPIMMAPVQYVVPQQPQQVVYMQQPQPMMVAHTAPVVQMQPAPVAMPLAQPMMMLPTTM